MDPLHAPFEVATDDYTHIECYCPRCRMARMRPISWLPRISLGLTIAQLSERLRCAECGGQLHSAVVPLSFKWVTEREDRTPLGPLVEAGREDGALPQQKQRSGNACASYVKSIAPGALTALLNWRTLRDVRM